MKSRTHGAHAPLAALEAFRRGDVVVLAPSPRQGGGACLVAALENVSDGTLSFLRRHTRGMVSVLLPDRQLHGIRLFLSRLEDPDGTALVHRLKGFPGERTEQGPADGLLPLLHALAGNPADAERIAVEFGDPFVAMSGAGTLSWPDSDPVVSCLTRRSGLADAALICSLFDDRGRYLQGPEVAAFAIAHGVPVIHPEDLEGQAADAGLRVAHVASSRLPTRHGEFILHAYRSALDGAEHAVLVWGDVAEQDDVPVRLHSECLTGDAFGSLRCDCGPQLDMSLARIAAGRCGLLIYLRGHEGRGIGLGHKVRAYALQDEGLDTVDANVALGLPVDARSFVCAADILRDLRVRSVHLLSNNPKKRDELVRAGIPVHRVIPVVPPSTQENVRYLRTKKARMGHDLPFE
ncbi:GTP cyclohydrolase II [Zoogloea sp. LCSB751]|uniref:GTP cyclohydrolase II n=1 Tax=Zoogloea sp. LCSB751 TaxID=1965277 RepID=UPI00137480AA|nr:GTP cyclohydrolase II [Zoogloea sp. LCSB751]